MYRSVRAFAADAAHNKLLAIPAGLYAVNNYLKFGMQLYFKPTTAKMLSNMKVGGRACRQGGTWLAAKEGICGQGLVRAAGCQGFSHGAVQARAASAGSCRA